MARNLFLLFVAGGDLAIRNIVLINSMFASGYYLQKGAFARG
jgi:hypothetical protein